MPKSSQQKIFLGLDPGLAQTGYGIIKKQGDQLELIKYGCIETDKKLDFAKRLEIIHLDLTKIIKKFKPQVVACEELFFCKNVKTALSVGQARGVIVLTAMLAKKDVRDYTPLQVKQALTGYGQADKKQIQKMVQIVLDLKELPKPDDAADALAVAICAAQGDGLRQVLRD